MHIKAFKRSAGPAAVNNQNTKVLKNNAKNIIVCTACGPH